MEKCLTVGWPQFLEPVDVSELHSRKHWDPGILPSKNIFNHCKIIKCPYSNVYSPCVDICALVYRPK